MSASERLKALVKRSATEPLGVDISDFSDEWCAGFLAGQDNALNAVGPEELIAVVEAAEKADSRLDAMGLREVLREATRALDAKLANE